MQDDTAWGTSVSQSTGESDLPPALDMAEVVFRYLAAHESFEVSVLRAVFPNASDQQFGLAFHEARERARDELQVEFITRASQRAGFYFRADAQQRLNRASRFIRTANRKLLRSMRVIDAIPASELDEDQFRRAQRTVDRAAEQVGRREAARRRHEEAVGFVPPETSRPQRPTRSSHVRQPSPWPETSRPGRGGRDGD